VLVIDCSRKPSNHPVARRLGVGFWLFLILAAASTNVGAEAFITIKDGPPPGFEDLAGKQRTEADVFFAGEYLTSAYVEFDPSHVELLDPWPIVESIPTLKNPQRIAEALVSPLPTNAGVLCTTRRRSDCGKLSPAVAAVTFDESRFRLDLFVNPRELLVQKLEIDRYLPASEAGSSVLHNLRVNVAGTGSNERYNIGGESFIAAKQSRLRARYAVSQEGANLYEVSWQHDAQDYEFEMGSFRATGRNLAFTGDVDIIGLRIATSTKTRTDLDSAGGTPILIFLPQRSRIDVFRGNELIDTRYYDAGNRQIDTSSFPEGAYEITLKTVEAGGQEKTWTRFFSRSASMPPMGEPQYFMEAGTVADTFSHSIPHPIDATWMRVGTSHRILDMLSVDAELLYAVDKALVETGFLYLARRWNVHAGLMGSSRDDRGYSLRGGLILNDFNLSLDYRRVVANDPVAAGDEFALIRGDYTQGTVTAAFPWGKGQAFIRARLNKQSGQSDSGVGFSYWGSLFSRNGVSVNYTFDSHFGSHQRWAQLGVTVRWQGRDEYTTFAPRLRTSRDDAGQQYTDAFFDGRWNKRQQFKGIGEVNEALYLTHDPDRSALGARLVASEYRHSDLEFGLQNHQDNTSLYYSMNHRFSVVHSDGHTTLGDGGSGAGGVIINIVGDLLQKFQVLVNDRVVGYAQAQRPHVIPLRAYETYDVRIKPIGDSIVGYDQASQRITLYPGNVASLTFEAKELTVIIAQVQHADGTPVQTSRFLNVEGYGATDADGWFQVEVGHREPLQLRARNGDVCEITIEGIDAQDGLAVLDLLVCEPIPAPRSAAGALDIGQPAH
jgi:outer membrane usher protein FimD/PapC